MTTRRRLIFVGGYAASLPLCLLLATGCNKQAPPPPTPTGMGSPPGGMGGGPGGGGGQRGGMRGGGQPVAANASGTEIYQAKCGCHGDQGKGKNAPALTATASKSESALVTIVHDGKGKMPAFASQLSDDQIKKVVATIKQFK